LLRFPDIVIPGYVESGTSALYEYLCEHPKVIPNEMKETNHFDCGWHEGIQSYKNKLKYFRKKDESQKTIDATPNYVFHPLVPRRIFKQNPQAKILIDTDLLTTSSRPMPLTYLEISWWGLYGSI